jgi:hypothetical protein
MQDFENKQPPSKDDLKKYREIPPEMLALHMIIFKNREHFLNVTLPGAPVELLARVEKIIEGIPDEEIISILNQINLRIENFLDKEEDNQKKSQAILEAVLIAQSFKDAVEQNFDREIIFLGFEEDKDISDMKELLFQVFDKELLQKCLISEIKYQENLVNAVVDNADYLLPLDIYRIIEKEIPKDKFKRFRARSLTTWNTNHTNSKKYIPTPIFIYGFYGEQPENIDYLTEVPVEQKMRFYKAGTVIHEIAHHVFAYYMDQEKLSHWKILIDQNRPITSYAESYSEKPSIYSESFCEAVRLKATVPNYLEENFPEIDKFLSCNFQNIQSVDLSLFY